MLQGPESFGAPERHRSSADQANNNFVCHPAGIPGHAQVSLDSVVDVGKRDSVVVVDAASSV